jgi:release factor glutamine methyltransferase
MSSSTPASDPARVVARLRAAGCVFAEDEARLILSAASTPWELDAMVARRVQGQPLEHILGWVEFCGLRIAVERGVFVPRRRTTFLVAQAVALCRPGDVIVDMCCGSGAVGAALAVAMDQQVEVHAADIDRAAVQCARRNLAELGGRVYQGDLFQPLPAGLHGGVDLLVANAPYVPTDAISRMPPEARDHEPQVALDGGTDGLNLQRRIAAAAAAWLTPTGHILVETSERQRPDSLATLIHHGFTARAARCDEIDATVVIGQLRDASAT